MLGGDPTGYFCFAAHRDLFPVLPISFPDSRIFFPVILSREFMRKQLKYILESGCMRPNRSKKLEFPCCFPVKQGI